METGYIVFHDVYSGDILSASDIYRPHCWAERIALRSKLVRGIYAKVLKKRTVRDYGKLLPIGVCMGEGVVMTYGKFSTNDEEV